MMTAEDHTQADPKQLVPAFSFNKFGETNRKGMQALFDLQAALPDRLQEMNSKRQTRRHANL